MVRFGLRIRLFEAYSHFQSIANPHPIETNPQIGIFRKIKNPKIRGRRQWAESLELSISELEECLRSYEILLNT